MKYYLLALMTVSVCYAADQSRGSREMSIQEIRNTKFSRLRRCSQEVRCSEFPAGSELKKTKTLTPRTFAQAHLAAQNFKKNGS